MNHKNRLQVIGMGAAAFVASSLAMGFTFGKHVTPPTPSGQLIFVSNRTGIVSGTPNGNEIWTMNADGTNPIRLTNNSWAEWEPQWNPGGSKIAFTSNQAVNGIPWDGNWDVYTMNPDGSGVTNITNSPSYDFGATWSPDGSKIAFDSDRTGNHEIFVMDEFGGNLVNLSNNAAAEGHPAWAPNGSKIAFFSTRDGNNEIYVMNADGSGQTRITNNAATDYLPTWSPDGTKIAFTSNRDGNFEIYSMNANGSGLTRLTNNAAEDIEPAWSPDGTKIVFVSLRNGNYEIYSMKSDGKGNPTRLTNNSPYLDADPTWKP